MKVDRAVFPEQRSDAAPSRASRDRRVPPQRNAEFEDVTLTDLRHRRAGLNEEESRVSYWRRIIQARLDLLSSGQRPGAQGQGLSRVLSDSRSSHRRIAALSLESSDELPPLPDLADLWQRMIPTDETEREELTLQLRDAERRLSEYRHELHMRIDQVTGELIARYREDPTLALTALHERLQGA